MSETIRPGATDVSTELRFIDAEDGQPVTVSAVTPGLFLYYRRDGGLKVPFAASDLLALDDAHTDGGLLAIDDDGYHRVDVPDAAFAGGADSVIVSGRATGVVVIGAKHPIAALTGLGTTLVDHNFGSADALRVLNPGGAPVNDATITAYLKSDYDAYSRSEEFIQGQTTTGPDGRWLTPLSLLPAVYVLVVERPPSYQTTVTQITVT